MINAPATFYQAMSDGNRYFLYRVEMTLRNGTTLEIENDKIWAGGFEFEDAVSGENDFQLGSAIINKFSLTLNNMSQEFSDYVFENAEVDVYIGLNIDENHTVMVRRGSYIVNEANHEDPLITLECYDAMVLFEKSYSESTLNYTNGVTLIDILREACSTCMVSLDPSISFDNQNLVIRIAPDGNSTTFRDVVSWIAQIAGCVARINPYGMLEFKQYNLSAMSSVAGGTDGGYFDSDDPYSSGDSVDGGTFNPWNDGDAVDGGTFTDFYDSTKPINYIIDVVSHKVSVNPISFTGLKISYKTGTDSAIDTATYGTLGYEMQIADNQFINSSNVTAIGTSLWNYVQHLAFWKATVSHLANPLIEAGDVAVFWDRNGNKYPIFVTKTSFTSGEAQTTICSAQDPARNSSGAVSIATKTYVEVQKIAREAKTAREIMYQTLAQAINSKAGLYMYVATEGGASVFYLHDQEELSQSKLVWKMTADAFAVTNDYNGAHPEQTVWQAGLTVDGNLIASVISTIGLFFDYAHGGTLTLGGRNNANGVLRILDSSDNQVGLWNNGGMIVIGPARIPSGYSQDASYTKVEDGLFSVGSMYNSVYTDEASVGYWVKPSNIEDFSDVGALIVDALSSNWIFLQTSGPFIALGPSDYVGYPIIIGGDTKVKGKIYIREESSNGKGVTIESGTWIGLGSSSTFQSGVCFSTDNGYWMVLETFDSQGAAGPRITLAPEGYASGYKPINLSEDTLIDANLYVNGTIYGTLASSSDERLKSIEAWSLSDEFLSEIEPIQFHWNNGTDDKLHFGFGAQSVKKLLDKHGMEDSGLVYYDEHQDRYYINYLEFIPILTDKVQRLEAENSYLKDQISSLEKRLSRLEVILDSKRKE